MKLWMRALLSVAVSLPLACSGGGSGTTGYTGTVVTDYVASWDGYAEAFNFEDGSDRIRFTLFTDGHGSIEVGDMPRLPPPTDPEVGYPPAPWNWRLGSIVATQLKPGFQYPLYNVRVEQARLRLGVDFHDVYADWCAMQTPHVRAGSIYECADAERFSLSPSDDGKTCTLTDSTTSQPVAGDCVKFLLCTQPPPCTCESPYLCQCNATSCAIPAVPNGEYPIKIDGALEAEGQKLVGTLATNDGYTRFTVRLTRQ